MDRWLRRVWVVLGVTLLASSAALSDPLPARPGSSEFGRWLDRRAVDCYRRLQTNLHTVATHQRTGLPAQVSVLAAPGGNPEYQDHWPRDAAVVMEAYRAQAPRLSAFEDTRARRDFAAYAAFSRRVLDVPARDAHGNVIPDEPSNGEAKVRRDGSSFAHAWGRPQDDGAALRARGIMASVWPTLEGAERRHHVNALKQSFGSDRGRLSVLRHDLDFLATKWWRPGFDLWEEVHARSHFYTRAVQYAALSQGAELAARLGEGDRARSLRAAAAAIRRSLKDHVWRGVFFTAKDVMGGKQYKRGLDASLILAATHTHGPYAPLSVLDNRLLATATALEDAFRAEYPLNRGRPSGAAVLIGRYPEDRYTGQPNGDRPGGGNPWVVTTHGFGEFYYRVAQELGSTSRFRVTASNRDFLRAALNDPHLAVGTVFRKNSREMRALRRALVAKGDGFIALVHEHINPDGSWAEQMDRHTGFMVGAHELSWNHASLLSAAKARREVGRL